MAALALIDQSTGEVLRAVNADALLAAAGIHDVTDAPAEQLAEFDDTAKALAGIIREARGRVSDEFVTRRDREVSGTLNAGPWKIVVASKAAGTVRYCPDRTPKVLRVLVEDGLISVQAANEACPDTTSPARVPWSLLHDVARALVGDLDQPVVEALAAEVRELLAGQPAPTYAPVTAKLAALRKAGGDVDRRLATCEVEVEPPKRTAKITRARESA